MTNAKGSEKIRNMMQPGKSSLLPPKIPFPSMCPPYFDYDTGATVGSKVHLKPKDGSSFHQRTSSESILMEEQPSWLDELLNEPETPVRRGHRRSSSDSFSYIDGTSMSNIDYVPASHDEKKIKIIASAPMWGFQNLKHYKDAQTGSFYADPNIYGKPKNIAWEQPMTSIACPGSIASFADSRIPQTQGLTIVPHGADPIPLKVAEMQDKTEFCQNDPKFYSEKKDARHTKTGSLENDTKRAKQQFAQRSRVRKLQYIAELERNVQALQAEGSEVSAELEFLNQQNLILSMENKALKQRLESLGQEQLIKCFEHEVLEREIGRLRTLYQQQQQHLHLQQPQQRQHIPSHRRMNSRDLDSQFANLSIKHKETGSSTDSINGSVRT